MSVATSKPREIFPRDMLPLGFGSGALLSKRRSRREALKLLETALDCGITYFDTARMYGSGRAETILGELVARNRDRLILASKAGILPQSRSIFVRAIGRGVRFLHNTVPMSKRHVPEPATYTPRFGFFGLADIRKSVETSLKELRTDYLDILLMHECTASDFENAALLNYLDDLKKEGKIRAFGIATGIEETTAILGRHKGLSDVVQIPSAIWNMNIKKLSPMDCGLVITHSSLTGRFNLLLDRLSKDENMAAEWYSMTHVDPRDATGLAQLLLAHALKSNPNGLVVFFSSSPQNIVASVNCLKKQTIDEAQIEGLNALLARSHVRAFLDSSY
ncbi:MULTISPECIES: aldo/keto reductase [unclassified Bradyrhizobium]|uniref:aldo/keto reductase n=1 Tax=unclassified Bradyrhizobium TaxID=2631580 RepID=UPI002FF15E8D